MHKKLSMLRLTLLCFAGTVIANYDSPLDKALGRMLLNKNSNVLQIGEILQKGADPNNRLHGASAFLIGFINALQRDETGRITGVDPEGFEITHLLAAAGGNPHDLDQFLIDAKLVIPNPDKDDANAPAYIPNEEKFIDENALQQTHAFLTSLEKMFMNVQAYNRQNAWFKFLYNAPRMLYNWPVGE